MARYDNIAVATVVVIDDELSMREFLQILMQEDGHDVHVAASVAEGLDVLGKLDPDLVFTDLKLPDGSGLEVLEWLRDHQPETQVIMVTAYASAETAVQAIRLGAYDYQTKPFQVDEVRAIAERALEKGALIRQNRHMAVQLQDKYSVGNIISRSDAMRSVVALIHKVAPSQTSVLIEGESGVGKELVARAIHSESSRATGPFVAVNCGAIAENLIESELFGHAAGSFTGASKARAGLFEAANKGTILLDEVGELPMPMQVKLLRVLQERTVRRVGEDKQNPVDIRVVAATNRDLEALVKTGEFREDLFYRLNVVRIRVPPLRQRREDIPMLITSFIQQFSQSVNPNVFRVDGDALDALCRYDWPGNVRQLQNMVERGVTLASGEAVSLRDLPEDILGQDEPGPSGPVAIGDGFNLEALLVETERRYLQEALRQSGGIKTKAAALLGLSFRSFRYRLQKSGLASDNGSEM